MGWITSWRAAGPGRALTGLLTALLLAAPLTTPDAVRAATIDLTACASNARVNGTALVAALRAANSSSEDDTINVGACVYELSTVYTIADGPNGLPSIAPNGALTLYARAPGAVIRRAAGAPPFRLLHIQSGATVKIQNIALRNGLAQGSDGRGGSSATAGADGRGGAIFNRGNLQLWDMTFERNTARGGAGGANTGGAGGTGAPGGAGLGGAVYSQGTLALYAEHNFSEVHDNQALGGAGGAGSANTGGAGGAGGAGGFASGGAIYSAPGAGLTSVGQVYAYGNLVRGGTGGAGGGSSGGAGGVGGAGGAAQAGVLFYGGSATLLTANLVWQSDNVGGGAGGTGGAGVSGGAGGAGGDAEGGALAAPQARLTFVNEAVFATGATGGTGGAGGPAAGGVGGAGGAGGSAQGGALKVGGIAVDLSRSTMMILPGAYATGGAGGAGGAGGGLGGAGGKAQGGSVYSQGDVSLPLFSQVMGNQATGGAGARGAPGGDAEGGAIFVAGVFAVDRSLVIENAAQGGAGGAGASGGAGRGGAFYDTGLGSGSSSIMADIQGNRARGGQGGAGGAGGSAQGGAIFSGGSSGFFAMQGANLTNNRAEGGAGQDGGAGGDAQGGLIYAVAGAGFRRMSFSDNHAQGGAGSGGGAGGSAQGGAIFSLGGASLGEGGASNNTATAGLGATAGVPRPTVAQGGLIFARSASFTSASVQNNHAIGGAATDGDGQNGGDAQGGAVYLLPGGALRTGVSPATLEPSEFSNNSAVGGRAGQRSGPGPGNTGGRAQGGAIFSGGGVSLYKAIVSGNEALGGQGGAAEVSGVGGDAGGGALYLAGGSSSFSEAHFVYNSASGGGGGDGTSGDGSQGAGSGGAIVVAGGAALSARTCNLNYNQAAGGAGVGGALLAVGSGAIGISNCRIGSNTAPSGGGLVIQAQTNPAASLRMVDTTIDGNSAAGSAGGLDLAAPAELQNVTIDGNSAAVSAGGVQVRSAAALDHITVVGNTADRDTDGEGDGGGILVSSGGTLTLSNSIVALNSDATSPLAGAIAPDLSGNLAGGGYNLIGDGSGGAGFAPTDLVGTPAAPVDPLLGPPAYGGGTVVGPTVMVRPPLAGSPAIDAGDPVFGPNPPYDQRGPGYARISNGRTDIGAVEVQDAAADL